MVREPGEPTEAQSNEAEQRFRAWCVNNLKDPDSQQSASEYEEWWDEAFPPGEEERW